MQVIILVEAAKKGYKGGSDYFYISSFIKHRYDFGAVQPKLTTVYMGSKTRCMDQEKKINSLKRAYQASSGGGEFVVVMCLDSDDGSIEKNKEIERYCQERGFHLVWFVRDIEEVFLGKRVSHTEKTKCAEQFMRNDGIRSVDMRRLSMKDLSSFGSSNIATVFDCILKKL